MPATFEFHCFGGRLGGSVERTLAAIGLEPSERGPIDVLDHGDGGIWVRGPSVGDLAPRLAAEAGRAVRHYRVRASAVEAGVEVEVEGATWWPDGRRVAIGGVEDRFDEEATGDLRDLATQALAVTLEVHEQLHHDDVAVSRWKT